jgi:uncharacterized protein
VNEALLNRIAEALERIAPAPRSEPPVDAPAYVWRHTGLIAVPEFAPLPLGLLTAIDAQRDAILENGRRLANGHAAHDALLWGARGSGKSALVKSSVGALQAEGLDIALVEVPTDALPHLPDVFTLIRAWARPTIVFIDDLAFEGSDGTARALRSVLEGGAEARPPEVRLYVTSNRRHILSRDMAEQDSAINPRDVIDDRLALADRFGLSLGFHACDQEAWLAMVDGYARRFGLTVDRQDALTWLTQRGARSGRMAWHYAVELAGREGQSLSR